MRGNQRGAYHNTVSGIAEGLLVVYAGTDVNLRRNMVSSMLLTGGVV